MELVEWVETVVWVASGAIQGNSTATVRATGPAVAGEGRVRLEPVAVKDRMVPQGPVRAFLDLLRQEALQCQLLAHPW